MGNIRVNTESVRAAGRRLLAEAREIEQMRDDLERAIDGLDTWSWDGRSRWETEPLLNRVRPQGTQVANELERLGLLLRRVADTFEDEDRTAARNLEEMPWVEWETDGPDSSPSANNASDNSLPSEKSWLESLEGWLGTGATVWDGIKILPAVASVLKAPYVSGLTGNIFKDAWALGAKNLTRGWRDLNQPIGFSPLVVGTIGEVVSEIGENWQEYEGDVAKVGLGIVVDTFLGVGGSLIGGSIGTFAGAAIGSVFGPVGTVIGGKIGGMVGGWLGGKAAEWVENIKIGDKELDQVIVDTAHNGLNNIVDKVLDFF